MASAGATDAEGDGERMATPVTIVTGFLGSGKTTLLKHILSGDHGKKIAVIQNELAAETGIEAPGTRGVQGPNGEVFADWVELANGCVCCSVRDDLVSALEVLVKREQFHNILIETTGLADPGPLASIFWLDEALESALRLDAIVTVVDCKYCKQHLDEKKKPGEVNECARQIAFADRIIMNKQDLVTESEREALLQRIRCINSEAQVRLSDHSKVPVETIIGIAAFDLDHAAMLLATHQREEQEALHLHQHGHEHNAQGECGICRQLREPQQLHPKHGDSVGTVTLTIPGELDLHKFKSWIGHFLWEEQKPLGVEIYRCKGLLSICGEDRHYVLQGVHETFELEPGPTQKESKDRPFAPPVNKFVFIGKCLDRVDFRARLQSCYPTALAQPGKN